jgi:hypothetical protein
MLQRLAALFFILALAGQVLAGVCVCLDDEKDNHSKMSCCLRKKGEQPTMSKKKCCDTPCGQPADNVPQSQSESSVKIPIVVRKAVERLIISLDQRAAYDAFPAMAKRAGDESPPLVKPPVLYLRNHAFLI